MIIDVQNVNKKYGKVHVLRDINLQVPEGSAFALVGTNGAGKTTTIRMLANIIRPDSGRANILGIDSRALSYEDYLQIGYVSENQSLPSRLTIEQYFDYLRPLYANWDRGFEKELRKKLDLPASRALSKLSHGMRMKTVLTAAMAFRPKLLILDEPLSGLDSLVRDEVIEGLLEQAGDSTILISSHELNEIENFTSHLAFMAQGELWFQQPIDEMRSRFREVAVTLSNQKELPVDLPCTWLDPVISGHSLQFIDTEFKDESVLFSQLTQHFGAIQFDTEAMSLRDITKTLIRKSRDESRD
ncbi:MAG: ABC transporter [SAR86 cluster bacterium]|uniref:ABC transporter n=1 Tax=SAR86 cluster bacterium TaxID=2030880 RepID=A0A2A4XHZ1_9GAMM|nr:MAG: ABC transporter [SAR86 cluster bacterium]